MYHMVGTMLSAKSDPVVWLKPSSLMPVVMTITYRLRRQATTSCCASGPHAAWHTTHRSACLCMLNNTQPSPVIRANQSNQEVPIIPFKPRRNDTRSYHCVHYLRSCVLGRLVLFSVKLADPPPTSPPTSSLQVRPGSQAGH